MARYSMIQLGVHAPAARVALLEFDKKPIKKKDVSEQQMCICYLLSIVRVSAGSRKCDIQQIFIHQRGLCKQH